MNKIITLTVVTIITVMGLTSCSADSATTVTAKKSRAKADNVKAKVQHVFYNQGKFEDVTASGVEFRQVDPMVEPGDIIEIRNVSFRVISIDRGDDDYVREHLRAYQVELTNDSVKLYDGNRLVYAYRTDWKTGMDSAILKDNE